jgi:uncharacterized protein (TIGR00369 family)
MQSARRRTVAAQNVSRMCLVCGVENAAGLRARFYELAPVERADAIAQRSGDACRELLGVFVPRPEHQSYPGRLHGGIASAILDETIGRAITMLHPAVWGVTAELTVRYLRPVPLDHDIRAIARITRDTRRLFEGTGEILLADGTVAVTASGKYVKLSLAEITQDVMDEAEWFADDRPRPAAVDLAEPGAADSGGEAEL